MADDGPSKDVATRKAQRSSSLLDVLACRGVWGAEHKKDNANHGEGGDVVLVLDGGVSTHLEAQWGHNRRCCCRSTSRVVPVADGGGDQQGGGGGACPREGPPNGTAAPREEEEDAAVAAAAGGCFVPRELWSSAWLLTPEGRNAIRSGHKDWVQAGANVLSTVTYQLHTASHLWPLELKDNPSLLPQLWNDGVRLAREAATEVSANEQPVWVVASLGCYGAALANGAEYTGDYGAETTLPSLEDFHAAKLDLALTANPDAVVWETIPSLLECQALARLLLLRRRTDESSSGETDTAVPVAWVSLACRDDGAHLNDGTSIEHALEAFDAVPLSLLPAIGFNCVNAKAVPSLVEQYLVHSIASSSSRPRRALALYPNSGEAWDAVTANWIPANTTTTTENGSNVDDAADVDSQVVRILWQSVDWIRSFERKHHLPAAPIVVGGCCRTTLAEIAALRRRADDDAAVARHWRRLHQ